jgi:hypothetical protein
MKAHIVKIFTLMAMASLPVFAHHSAAMFDKQVEVIMTGVVLRFDYLNPHAWLYVDVENDDGTTTEWGFELSAPPLLRRQGISPSYWKAGDRVNLKANPLRDGRPSGGLKGIIKSDGSLYRDGEGLEAPGTEES